MDSTEAKLTAWVKRNLWNDESVEGFVIRHVGMGGKTGGEVESFAANSSMQEEAIAALVRDLYEACNTDAEGLGGGIQSYVIQPKRKGEAGGRGRFTLRVACEAGDDDSLATEPPNKTGLLTQFMRHLEVKERTVLPSMVQLLGIQAKMIGQQAEQLEKMMGRSIEMMDTMEQLTQAKHERELEAARQEAKLGREQEVLEQVMQLAPILKAKLLGPKHPINMTMTPAEEMVTRLFGSLTTEQMDGLMRGFTPTQQAVVVQLYEIIKAKGEETAEPKNGGTKS